MLSSQSNVTDLLLAWSRGEDVALEKLVPLVYRELRRRAHRYMTGERPGHTLQTTALIHETYLRLVDCRRVNWQNRAQFLGLCSRLMRRILVDFARRRRYLKRGGGARRISLDEALAVSAARSEELLAVDEVLKALAAVDYRKSRVVELRFFGGLTVEETAEVLRVSRRTVLREWDFARAWLLRELTGSENDEVRASEGS